ncbi:MAG: integration host factor subunit alpha [Deltaproteobacteria bacterium]|nr:integration host factor subunit alpha [Deltaproteobacteria bacterium]MBW1911123.1 integration host factor subunit alpha [Deltaproteobacteria bacterium]MBW2035805.1 integration host factor subunit alpha [Deltaproteobacteria bacterium]
MTLTKANIIDSIYNSTDLNRSQATKAVKTLLESIKTTLEFGEDVLITGFGKFYVNVKKERRGRNPATGENLMLPTRKVIEFKCSSVLGKKMNR